jgi:uncharacterized protein
MKLLYFILGWFFFTLGVIGVFLPLLPTTPFMLLALWAFSKSSQRFHNWLYHHKYFGPFIQKWDKHRIIPLKAKITAFLMITASFSFLIYRRINIYLIITSAIIMGYAIYFISTKPSSINRKIK